MDMGNARVAEDSVTPCLADKDQSRFQHEKYQLKAIKALGVGRQLNLNVDPWVRLLSNSLSWREGKPGNLHEGSEGVAGHLPLPSTRTARPCRPLIIGEPLNGPLMVSEYTTRASWSLTNRSASTFTELCWGILADAMALTGGLQHRPELAPPSMAGIEPSSLVHVQHPCEHVLNGTDGQPLHRPEVARGPTIQGAPVE